jgi:hypothetical protein
MGGVFGKQKIPKAPIAEPLPTEQQTEQAGEAEMRKQRRRSGFEKTFLTGSLTPNTGLRTTLGG